MAIETDCTDNPICPHCGYEHHDHFEWSRKFDSGAEHDCDACGATFHALREVTITWDTRATVDGGGGGVEP